MLFVYSWNLSTAILKVEVWILVSRFNSILIIIINSISRCVTFSVPFQSVTPSHVGWPTKLGSRQRDQSTSSVTKRANGHWHAIIASSCRWSPCEYKRQQVHRINSSFRFGAERWCITTALYFGVAERTRVRALRQQQRWSRSRGYQVRADKHTRSVRWPAPLRASALKEQIL